MSGQMAGYRTHYVSELTPAMDGQEVVLAGWVHEVRDIGKIKFIQLRDRTGIVQVIGKNGVVPDDVLKSMSLVKESVVQIRGKVKAEKQSRKGFEIIPLEVKDLNPVSATVPFELTGKVPAEIDVRLDNRTVDLRRLETQAIFRIQHSVLKAFREKLLEMDFQEIRTPCIVAAATEGGTEVFRIEYFEKHAYLGQSPQLYKQLAVIGGMDRVFMTVPVFRAEKHNTTTHLNEVLQMDVEMGFVDDNDAMGVLEATMLHILSSVKKECAPELETLGAKLDVPKAIPRYTYDHCLELLSNSGVKMEWGADFPKENEKKLFELIPEELFFITDWPTKARAFYAHPKDGAPEKCNAFDLIYRGLEIASGAQRIHKADMLIDALKSRGLDPADFEFYVRNFRFGAPPHAGWSIGAERLTMKLAGRENIREACLFPRDRHRLTP